MCQTIQSLLITSKEWSSFELCRLLVIFPGRPLSFAWFLLIRIFVCCCCFYNNNWYIIWYCVTCSCRKFHSFRFCQCLIFMTSLANRYSHQIRPRLQRLTLAPLCLWSEKLSNHHSHMSNHVSLRLLGRYLEGLHHRILPFMFFNLSFHLVPPWRNLTVSPGGLIVKSS